MNHEIKINENHYERVALGTKTFEIRNNDRNYQKGDTVELRAWYPEGKMYSPMPVLKFKIGDVYPIDSERVVFSLLKLEQTESKVAE